MNYLKFFRQFGWVTLVVSIIYIFDSQLPIRQVNSEVISTHRPEIWSKHGIRKSSEDVIIIGKQGRIKVSPYHLSKISPGDTSTLFKTYLLGIPKEIYLHRQSHLASAKSVLFGWLIFAPFLILAMSISVLLIKDKEQIMNFGGMNFVFFFFVIYIFFKDYIR